MLCNLRRMGVTWCSTVRLKRRRARDCRWWCAAWTKRRRAAAFHILRLKLRARRAKPERRHPRIDDVRNWWRRSGKFMNQMGRTETDAGNRIKKTHTRRSTTMKFATKTIHAGQPSEPET